MDTVNFRLKLLIPHYYPMFSFSSLCNHPVCAILNKLKIQQIGENVQFSTAS